MTHALLVRALRRACLSAGLLAAVSLAVLGGSQPLRAQAQTPETITPEPQEDDTGRSLMERGADLFFEGLRREMEPTLEEAARLFAEIGPSMRSFFAEMGPALAEIAGQVEDWSLYERPEILPNGDIIIRRKEPNVQDDPAPEDSAPDADPEGSIEL